MLQVDDVRLLLRIDEEDVDDEELKRYINYFMKSTLARIGLNAQKDPTVLENPTFQEAVMAAIACRLSLTDLDIIHAPSGYRVGDTEEDYKNTSFGNYGKIPSWCDQYDALLSVLSSQYASLMDLKVFRRHGMSCRRKWLRDLY